jgi:hypothetical protein
MSIVTFLYATYAGHHTTFGPRMETGPPRGAWGPTIDASNIGHGRSRVPTPLPRGPTIDISNIGGGRSWFPAPPPRGGAIDISNIGGGRS